MLGNILRSFNYDSETKILLNPSLNDLMNVASNFIFIVDNLLSYSLKGSIPAVYEAILRLKGVPYVKYGVFRRFHEYNFRQFFPMRCARLVMGRYSLLKSFLPAYIFTDRSFKYNFSDCFAVIGDNKADSKIPESVLVIKTDRWIIKIPSSKESNLRLKKEFLNLSLLRKAGVLKFGFALRDGVLFLENVGGTNMFDYFILTGNYKVFFKAIDELCEFYRRIYDATGRHYVHGDPGSLNFLVDRNRVVLVDWEGLKVGDSKTEFLQFINSLVEFYHKRYGPFCCLDGKHSRIKRELYDYAEGCFEKN